MLVAMTDWRNFGFGFFFSSRRRHTRLTCDWSSDVCSSDLHFVGGGEYRLVGHIGEIRGDPAGMRELADYRRIRRSKPSVQRSEERRVGKECRSRWSPYE